MSSGIIDLSWTQVLLSLLLLLIPALIFFFTDKPLLKESSTAIFRMIAQLCAIGFILQFIFTQNHAAITSLWLLLMILVADWNLIRRCQIPVKTLFFPVFTALAGGTVPVLLLYVSGIIQPQPFLDARYFIPVFGMILGNSMNSSILAVERMFESFQDNREEIRFWILMGASRTEATDRLRKSAFRASLLPIISSMTTMGLVSLPGMMTGQILGGNLPLTAIKYQICIVICIFSSIALSSYLSIRTVFPHLFSFSGIQTNRVLQ